MYLNNCCQGPCSLPQPGFSLLLLRLGSLWAPPLMGGSRNHYVRPYLAGRRLGYVCSSPAAQATWPQRLGYACASSPFKASTPSAPLSLVSLALSCFSCPSLSSLSCFPLLLFLGPPFLSLSLLSVGYQLPPFPLPSLNKLHVGAQSCVCVS